MRSAIEGNLPSDDFTIPPALSPFYDCLIAQTFFYRLGIYLEFSDRSSSACQKYKQFMEEFLRFYILIAIPLDLLPDRNQYLSELMARARAIVDSLGRDNKFIPAYKNNYETMQTSYKVLIAEVSPRYQHICFLY